MSPNPAPVPLDVIDGCHDAGVVDYLVSQSFNRLRLGTFFELLLFHLVNVSFPGLRLFLVFPCLPIVSMFQGVRICFFVFLILGLLSQHARSGASRPEFDRALNAIIDGDTLVITALDRLGRSTQNMLAFAEELRARGAGLRVLNLGACDIDAATSKGPMLFTIIAALAQMEHEIKCERVTDSIRKRREAGLDLGGRPRRITDSQIRNAIRLVESG